MVGRAYIARGDVRPPTPSPALTSSPLVGVDAEAWSRFVRALVSQGVGDATSDGFGRFAMRPRRLEDLGLMTNLRRVPDKGGRMIWEGDFVSPITREGFLGSLPAQVSALVKSVLTHAADLAKEPLPAGVSKSGALAILHCGGPGALKSWTEGPRFTRVTKTFEKANGIF